MRTDYLPWSVAWQHAAFGDDGFYRRHRPEDHFETSVMQAGQKAQQLGALIGAELARILAVHGRATITDFGAADGLLLVQLANVLPQALAERLTWRAVDVRPRPAALPAHIQYVRTDVREVRSALSPEPGVAVAHELLDDIPCDIVEIDDDGRRRVVLVDPATGHEILGPDLADDDACVRIGLRASDLRAWCDDWWPRRVVAARVEIGASRDDAWRGITATITDGLAIAEDYGHVLAERRTGRWDGGTLAGFRHGRVVRPVPDGSINLTAHVAMDSCAAVSAARDVTLSQTADGMWRLVQQMGP